MNSRSLPNEYTVDRLNASNFLHLEILHAAVYGHRPPKRYFEKKYNTAYSGAQYVGFIAYCGGEPVAFYGVLPCLIGLHDRRVLAAQSADTMTHPEHRKKGLFIRLALATFQLCEELEIKLLFGFPNQNSAHGFLHKLSWQNVGHLDYFVVSSTVPSAIVRLTKIPVIRRMIGRYRAFVLKKIASSQAVLANSVIDDGFYGVVHDRAWFNYKGYARRHIVRVGRSTVWLKVGEGMVIGDIETSSSDLQELVSGLESLAGRLLIGEIYFYACLGTALHSFLSIQYQKTPAFPIIFKSLGEDFPLDQIKFTSSDLDFF
jgi:GNAT superfamily N-acetyltransferase